MGSVSECLSLLNQLWIDLVSGTIMEKPNFTNLNLTEITIPNKGSKSEQNKHKSPCWGILQLWYVPKQPNMQDANQAKFHICVHTGIMVILPFALFIEFFWEGKWKNPTTVLQDVGSPKWQAGKSAVCLILIMNFLILPMDWKLEPKIILGPQVQTSVIIENTG